MKKIIKSLAFVFAIGLTVAGCKKGIENQRSAGNFKRSSSAFTDSRTVPTVVVTLPNVISSNTTLSASNLYIIDGPTYVANGATLTIPAGTFIKGKKTSTSGNPSFLLITKGSKMIANGTEDLPIVFTSDQAACDRRPGDWGGIVLLGNGLTNCATTNIIEGISAAYVPSSPFLSYPGSIEFGGSSEDDADNASSLKYIRIEFAGKELQPDNELNALTLGAVGSATTLEHIQASWGADDSFEWFGGSVNAKYLISYGANDDDYDFDYGYQGSVQFAVAVKLPCIGAYSANPNGIECNNNTNFPTVNSRKTHPILTNFTLLGEPSSPGPTNGVGALFRQSTEFTFVNFLVGGFATGVNYTAAATSPTPVYSDGAIHAFTTTSNPSAPGSVATETTGSVNDFLLLADPFNLSCSCTVPATPDFSTASPVTGGTLPAVTHAGGSFPLGTFDPAGAGFQGAMGTTRWDNAVWASYNPQGNPY